MEQPSKIQFDKLMITQTKLYEENLKYNIIQWEGMKRDYAPGSTFQQIREITKTIPFFWYYVFYNSNYLSEFDENEFLEEVLKTLIDIEVTDFDQKLVGTPMLSNMKMMCTLHFHFSENAFFENETLSLTLIRNSVDENLFEIINNTNDIQWKNNSDNLLLHTINNNTVNNTTIIQPIQNGEQENQNGNNQGNDNEINNNNTNNNINNQNINDNNQNNTINNINNNNEQNNININNNNENNNNAIGQGRAEFAFFDLFTKNFKELPPEMKRVHINAVTMILYDLLPNCVHCFKGSLIIEQLHVLGDEDDEREQRLLRQMIDEIDDRINDLEDEIERNTNDINDIMLGVESNSNSEEDTEDDENEESDEEE